MMFGKIVKEGELGSLLEMIFSVNRIFWLGVYEIYIHTFLTIFLLAVGPFSYSPDSPC